MYYNPYFEDRTGKIESAPTYTNEQFLDLKPPSYFLALLRHNYIWTQRQGLDSFGIRVSPSFIFWHDRLIDSYPVSYLQEFFFSMMERAGLLQEPIFLMVKWARDIAENKVKTKKILIDSEKDESLVVDIPPESQEFQKIWTSNWVKEDREMFSKHYTVEERLFSVKEAPEVLHHQKYLNRWLYFLRMTPKES